MSRDSQERVGWWWSSTGEKSGGWQLRSQPCGTAFRIFLVNLRHAALMLYIIKGGQTSVVSLMCRVLWIKRCMSLQVVSMSVINVYLLSSYTGVCSTSTCDSGQMSGSPSLTVSVPWALISSTRRRLLPESCQVLIRILREQMTYSRHRLRFRENHCCPLVYDSHCRQLVTFVDRSIIIRLWIHVLSLSLANL